MRNEINKRIGKVVRMFKWATSQELIPSSVFHGLQSVSGLRRGRSGARESPIYRAHLPEPQLWAARASHRQAGNYRNVYRPTETAFPKTATSCKLRNGFEMSCNRRVAPLGDDWIEAYWRVVGKLLS
jgi:hypothetical protein